MQGFATAAWTLVVPRGGRAGAGFELAAAAAVDRCERQGWSAVFAGALYNREEIDARHGACACDAERVLRAFRADPQGFAGGLRGIFAAVLREAASGTLVAVRDRIGAMPLFVADAGTSLVFSPSMRLLAAHPAVTRRPNRMVLAEDLADLWSESRESYLESVRRVLPATVLRIDAAGEHAADYWDPADGPVQHDADAAQQAFGAALEASVARFMRMGRTAIFLSGGIDSISVAAVGRQVAHREGLPPPTALSLFYRESSSNEEEAQTVVARELGLPFIGLTLEDALQQRPALPAVVERSRAWPAPLWNLWLPAFLRLGAQGREAGCELVLTGGGGDEWLGVAPHLAADLLRSLRLLAYLRFARYMHRSYAMPLPLLLRNVGWTFGLKQLVTSARNHLLPAVGYDLDGSRARRALPDWLAPDPVLRRALVERVAENKRRERLARAAAGSLYEFEGRRSIRHPIVLNEIENKFAMGEEIGVRFFEPYWDADLVGLLYRTPPRILSRGGLAKGLVHRLVREALPGFEIPKQKKVALNSFYRRRVRAEAAAVWRESPGVPALARLGLVDERKFAVLVERLLQGQDAANLWLIPHVLSIEAWASTH